ncbi:MAG: hypothetical protein JWN19_349, partial [Arthrobacter sp.]|nr:hypothetical protein [Arthrobacter sp.]
IIGATASTYDIVGADNGHEIYVEVTGTAPGYAPNTQTTYYVVVDGDTDPAPVPTPAVPTTPVPAPAVPTTPVSTPAPSVATSAIADPTPTAVRNLVLAQGGGGSVQPQSAGQTRTPVARSGSQAGAVDAPAEAPAEPAEAAATIPDTAAATPTAAASPAPSSTQETTTASAPASSAAGYNPLPLALPILGVLIAIGLAWFVRPIRAAVTRLGGRQAK